jgi:hypothetical protein
MNAVASELPKPGKLLAQDPVPKEMARSRVLADVSVMKQALSSQLPVLRDIQDYISPYRGRFQAENLAQRGKRRGLKVINGTAGRAMKIMSSGLMAGLSSPARPWFKLTTRDPDLAEFGPHRAWLDNVARAMRATFAGSNLYNVLPSVYSELGPFGTTALLEVEDPDSVVRFHPFTIGTFVISQDYRLVVDGFAREYRPTVRQLAVRFGTDNLSARVRQLWQTGKTEDEVDCIHIIRSNPDPRGGFGWRSMPFIEEYWERAGERDEPIFRSGYRERALFVPRWDVAGDDLWGTGIGHEILGDVKQLQFLERRKEEVLDKHANPPLEVGSELRGKRLSLLAGDSTYSNAANTGGTAVRPILTTDPNAYRFVREDIGDLMVRIRQAAYEDLFLMISNDTRSGITAREVEERHQEKMLVLGPVLERLNEELFDPLIHRTFSIMQRRSEGVWKGTLHGIPLLPPPPRDMQGEELQVEYTSILAQAAKATNTRGIEAFGMFVGQLAQLFGQDVLDKVDSDQMVDEYADAQGIPAAIIRDDDTVEQRRSERSQQTKQQQALAAAPAVKDMADAAKSISEIPQDSAVAQGVAGAFGQQVPA